MIVIVCFSEQRELRVHLVRSSLSPCPFILILTFPLPSSPRSPTLVKTRSAQFTTVMHERHNTRMAVFGGKPGEPLEYKGMAGNQVLEWADLDSEIKTAGLKDVRVIFLFYCHLFGGRKDGKLMMGNRRNRTPSRPPTSS